MIHVDYDKSDIKKFGFSRDFYNEICVTREDLEGPPENLKPFLEKCARGEVRTYSERYADRLDILGSSDPSKVAYLEGKIMEL